MKKRQRNCSWNTNEEQTIQWKTTKTSANQAINDHQYNQHELFSPTKYEGRAKTTTKKEKKSNTLLWLVTTLSFLTTTTKQKQKTEKLSKINPNKC